MYDDPARAASDVPTAYTAVTASVRVMRYPATRGVQVSAHRNRRCTAHRLALSLQYLNKELLSAVASAIVI